MHVYVIGPIGGPFKIGIAIDILRRLSGIQTGSHQTVGCEAACRFADVAAARVAERALHLKFRSHRLRGEWFDVAPADVLAAAVAMGGEAIEPLKPRMKSSCPKDTSESKRKAMYFESMARHQSSMSHEQIRAISRHSGLECDGPALIERLWQRTLSPA